MSYNFLKLAAFAEEEYRQHTGSHVGTGHGLVGAKDQFHGLSGGADFFRQFRSGHILQPPAGEHQRMH